ncbi:MAG: hypothetical protein M3N52_07765 [Actinomycetota bacterium]|nr:hypothetical protein [Actinomycetota bacterium]
MPHPSEPAALQRLARDQPPETVGESAEEVLHRDEMLDLVEVRDPGRDEFDYTVELDDTVWRYLPDERDDVEIRLATADRVLEVEREDREVIHVRVDDLSVDAVHSLTVEAVLAAIRSR